MLAGEKKRQFHLRSEQELALDKSGLGSSNKILIREILEDSND